MATRKWAFKFTKAVGGPKLVAAKSGDQLYGPGGMSLSELPRYILLFTNVASPTEHTFSARTEATWKQIEEFFKKKLQSPTPWLEADVDLPTESPTDPRREKFEGEPDPRMMALLADVLGCDPTKGSIEHRLYKGVDCGPWISFGYDWVDIGSIVEGVDFNTDVVHLDWPFTAKQFWDAVQQVDDEAKYIWGQTHGCDDCQAGEGEWGGKAIDPNCPTCKGGGAII